MIITTTHWLLAALIAVSVHLAGMLLLSLPQPSRPPEAEESVGRGIVVTLGRGARATAEPVEAWEPTTGAAPASASEVSPDAASDAVETTPSAETPPSPETAPEGAPEPAETRVDPEPEESPEPVEPQAVESAPSEASPPSPEETLSPQPAEPEVTEPSSVAAPEAAVADVEPEPVISPEAAKPEPAEAPEPVSSQTPVEPDAPSTRQPASTQAAAEPEAAASVGSDSAESVGVGAAEQPAEASEVQSTAARLQPTVSVPTRAAEDAPVPESAAAPEESEVRVVDSEAAPLAGSAGVQATAAETASDLVPAIEDIATVRPDADGPAVQPESAAPEPAAGAAPDVEAAAARQPATEVQARSAPETVELEAPETIDLEELEELEEASGGSGVVARYAGVLKGWLKRSMHYPRAARVAGHEGEVVVRFVIDRRGNVQSIELESESGYPMLDREAREMIERGAPFPGIPEEMPGERLEIRVPVSFQVREETKTKEIPPIYLE